MLRHHYRCYGTTADGFACSAVPEAARSAKAATAAPGTPPAPRRWARGGCHHSGPPPLRPAARRPVPLAKRRRRTRPDRATGRAQHHHAPGRLHPLHRRPGRHHQPANRACPPHPKPVTAGQQAVPRTAGTTPILSAICPCMAHTRAPGRPPASRARSRPELPLRSPMTVSAAQSTSGGQQRASRAGCWTGRIWPTYGPQRQQAVCGTACFQR